MELREFRSHLHSVLSKLTGRDSGIHVTTITEHPGTDRETYAVKLVVSNSVWGFHLTPEALSQWESDKWWLYRQILQAYRPMLLDKYNPVGVFLRQSTESQIAIFTVWLLTSDRMKYQMAEYYRAPFNFTDADAKREYNRFLKSIDTFEESWFE